MTKNSNHDNSDATMAVDPLQKQPKRGPGRPFRPGQSGNPAGRPRGSRNRATMAAELLLDGEAEALTRKAMELALAGDTNALRLCVDRILPRRREREVTFHLPPLRSPGDATAAMAAIIAAVAAGEIVLGEAAELSTLVQTFMRAIEMTEFEIRLRSLEARG